VILVLTKFKYLSMVALLVFGLCQNASAELAAVGAVNSTNGFPSSYTDENGLALGVCLTPGICVFDPSIVSNPFSQQIGFGEKAFYWSADADLSGPGALGSLNMALVASFSGSTTGPIPANGEQITFVQIVIGPISNLTPGGVYTVIHPFGVLTNLVADASGVLSVRGQVFGCVAAPCDFTAALGSGIGPFLRWDTTVLPAPPTGFIGDPTILHKVIGSPFGNNFFSIEGPNAGGSGVDTKQTDLFRIQGALLPGAIPALLVVERTTYTRPLPNAVDVFATSARSATLQVSGIGIGTTTMKGDGNGKFFAHIPFTGSPPNLVNVTASNPSNTPTAVQSKVVDIVMITLAEYNSSTQTLTVEASSSDGVATPTLAAVGFGNLPGGRRVFPGLTIPPTEVTVISSAGGSDTAQVTVTANVKPVATNDSALTKKNTAVLIDVLANDTAKSGTLDPATVTVVTPPAHGSTSVNTVTGEVTYTPGLDFVGKDSFRYTVNDSFAQVSNIATVNITVVADEVLTVTKAIFTVRLKRWQISGKSTVKAGNVITLYLGPDTSGTIIGTAKVNAFGGWSFSKSNSPVDPGGATSVTAESTIGTVVTFSPLTIK
jgi:hypothetical protein